MVGIILTRGGIVMIASSVLDRGLWKVSNVPFQTLRFEKSTVK